MSPLTFKTLRLLADGEFRSGEGMARALGVSRASVWNADGVCRCKIARQFR